MTARYTRGVTWLAPQRQLIFRAALAVVALLTPGCVEGDDERDDAARSARRQQPAISPPSAKTPALEAEAPANEPAPARALSVVFGGDVSFARATGRRMLREPSFNPLARLAPLLRGSDVSFANLESPLCARGTETQDPQRPLVFSGPASGARALSLSGFDLVSLANNHIWDYGRAGLLETLTHLEQAGVRYVGVSGEPGFAEEPQIMQVNGWSLAWLAVTDVWNPGEQGMPLAAPHVAFANAERYALAVRELRDRHDLIFVSYHGGREYSEHVSREQRAFARAIMQAGADAFVGHHSHVVQGIEWFDARPAFYSLGNLRFERSRASPATASGMLARLRFERGQRPRVEMCPYRIDDDGPVPVGEGDALEHGELRRRFARVASYAGFTTIGATAPDGCLPVQPRLHAPEQARPRQ